jgi:hypothetical protein
MHKLLDTSTAAIPTGVPPQRKLLMIESGPYAGRLFCMYNESPGTIAITWADPPYTIWANPYNQVTDSADYPPSACIDSQGNIYIVYVQQTTLNVIFFKLPFSGGMWQSGMPATVFDVDSAFYPVIARNNDGDLWCAFAYYDSVNDEYTIRAKSSTDGGMTWGSGPSDMGTAISGAFSSMPYVSLSFAGNDLNAVYCENRSDLYLRKHVSSWEPAQFIYGGNYIDADFDCAVSDDMKLGIAFAPSTAQRLYFREYDGVTLGGLQEVYNGLSKSPQLAYKINRLFIFYAQSIGNGLYLPRCSYKESGLFVSTVLIDGINAFSKLLLYEQSGQSYEDKTAEAFSLDTADIYHSVSGALLSSAGDCIYFGGEGKFFCISVVLSTAGSSGIIEWEYYNGQSWTSFNPQSGDIDLDEVTTIIYLWSDLRNAPDGWQVSTVNGHTAFWVRARVTGSFTVAPVGSQLTAVPKCMDICIARGSS